MKALVFGGSRSESFIADFMFMVPCIINLYYSKATRCNCLRLFYFILLQDYSTCFEFRPHPSSGVHQTVTTASGTGHIICAATSLQRGQVGHVGGR